MRFLITSWRQRGPRLLSATGALLAVMAGAGMPRYDIQAKPVTTRNAEDLLIVDCLLPGQVRKLGAAATFMSARRPIRTTQADCEIRGGEYVAYDRANYQTALQVWMTQALSGSAEAQNYVGEIYLKGLGIPPDYGMAAQWFQKAADQGLKRAKSNLAYLYEQGLGVAKDELKALNLYREAAGATGDELLFASTVQVQLEAKDTEIAALKDTVAQQRQEAEALKAKVRDLQAQLEQRKQALNSSRDEIEALRQKLAEARRATGADFAELERRQAALAQREAELQQLMLGAQAEKDAAARRQQQLEQQTAALAVGKAGDTALAQEQSERLRRAVAEAQQRAEALEAQLVASRSELDRERQSYQQQLAALEAQAAGRKQEDWDLMKTLESQLAQREAQM
ncbi:MAG TPA: hypothetical protein VEA16_00290, partial [Vicinamibacterales bacterium]|nr:hypothetical protein [Vicinamibacterales bacterium]